MKESNHSEGYGAKVIAQVINTKVEQPVLQKLFKTRLFRGNFSQVMSLAFTSLDTFIDTIRKDNQAVAWNATGPIEKEEELMRHSFVKCAIHDHRILYCFRKVQA